MLARYGNFVTYDPPMAPATVFLWLMPLFLIGLGGVILFKRNKRAEQAGSSATISAHPVDNERLKQILNDKE